MSFCARLFGPAIVAVVIHGTFCCGEAVAQTRNPSEAMRLQVDYSRFRGDDKNIYVEVYYSFPQKGITYQRDTAGFTGAVAMSVAVMAKDSLVYSDQWLVPHVVKDTSSMKEGMNLVGVANFGVGEGNYTLKVLGKDRNNPSRQDSVLMKLPIKMIDASKMTLSDLELASNIRQGTNGSVFYKNTLEVIPNVDGVYSEDQRCHFYIEAYNLLGGQGSGDYYVKTTVYDAINREVISRERPKKRHSESSVIIDNLDVKQLKSGTYTLVIGLLDSTMKPVSRSGKKFFVYNPTLGVDSTLLTAGSSSGSISDYAGVAEADIDKEFAWAIHESSEAEESQYKQLQGEDTKRKFISDFWQRRPLGLKEEYLKRVGYANAHFRVLGREGYKTDRGRVYITYGPPDDYDRHPNDSNSRPYEVWTFNAIQGGVIFVFVQRSSGGDYELVHSTHRNELHDENWGRYALTN